MTEPASPTSSKDITASFDALENGLLILTPNHRTNVLLLESYGEHRASKSLPAVCLSPNIFPIDIWFRACTEELINSNAEKFSPQIILESFQELFLWKKIIQDSSIGSALLNLEGTASTVIDAYRTIQQWDIPLTEIEKHTNKIFGDTEDYTDIDVFIPWLKEYEKQTKKDNIVSLSQALNSFIEHVNQGLVSLPTEIVLLGFENPPPLYQRLFQSLEQAGSTINRKNFQTLSPSLEKKEINNQSQEVLAAAHWSQNILHENPNARIGIICPDLNTRKAEVQRTFNNHFYPNQALGEAPIQNTCFSSTTSEKLDSQSLIQTALMLLKLNGESLTSLEIFQILHSPFLLAAQEEADGRAALEILLRKKSELKTRLADLRFFCSQADKPWYCPILGKALIEFENCRQQYKGKRNLIEWSALIEQQLALAINFSTNEQSSFPALYIEQWYDLLKQFKHLAYLNKPLPFSGAIELLNQLARHTNASTFFNQASIQIMAPVEASGLQFSHLWFMGLSESAWPPQARSNPFIPVTIQQAYETPGANAELQYQAARELLQHLHQSTSDSLVFSYPQQADDILLKPSRLLEEFVATINSQPEMLTLNEGLHPLSQQLFSENSTDNKALETFEESLHIPLQDNENPTGGTALIADQAACPFRSFAKHRLNATELPKLSYGLPAYAVGNMLHHAMEVFWQNLKDQNSIENLDPDEQDSLINKAAKAAIKQISQRFPQTMTVAYSELEIVRLSELLHQWLNEERKRDFFSIVEHEYALEWQYSNLNLKFRIDRIEQFEDKSFGLVDYKTSKNNNVVNWFDERQDKPQLLLYLQAAEKDPKFSKVSSLLYAQVNIEEMKYRGIAENPDTYPGVALEKQRGRPADITWETLRENWKLSLESLAQEFLDGYLPVQPKSSSTCQYCHLSAFCRIQEQRQRL